MISCRPVCPEIAAGYDMVRMKYLENQISQMKTISQGKADFSNPRESILPASLI